MVCPNNKTIFPGLTGINLSIDGGKRLFYGRSKAKGEPFESEMPPMMFSPVPMPPGVKQLKRAELLLITDGGLVPKGNPEIFRARRRPAGSDKINGCADLKGEDYEILHGGYDPQFVREDPDRLVPLDVMRELEQSGAIAPNTSSTCTSSTVVPLTLRSSIPCWNARSSL